MSAEKLKAHGTLPGRARAWGPGNLSLSEFAQAYRQETMRQWRALDMNALDRIGRAVLEARRKGGTVYVLGNGGSAATASHMATDFSKTAHVSGAPRLRCVSLADNNAYMTAIGNDLSFDDIFSHQLEGLLKSGDVVILISGSGNSRNLISAAKLANARRALTVGLLGFDGGKLKRLVRIPLLVPSEQYGVIEDVHMGIGHIITFYLKQMKSKGL